MYLPDTVELYDEIYTRMKNYGEEAGKIRSAIQAAHPKAESILDVACGTAEHAKYLKAHYRIDGLDLGQEFLEVAKRKNPECGYFQGDMRDFSIGRRYDVVMTLFSSIGYVLTEENLERAFRSFARHLNPGGVVIVEPWLTPQAWNPGKPFMFTINEPEFKVCRMNITETREGYSYFKWHFLVARPGVMKSFTEEHTLGLFSVAQTLAAFARAGYEAKHDPEGIFGRGLYVARLEA